MRNECLRIWHTLYPKCVVRTYVPSHTLFGCVIHNVGFSLYRSSSRVFLGPQSADEQEKQKPTFFVSGAKQASTTSIVY